MAANKRDRAHTAARECQHAGRDIHRRVSIIKLTKEREIAPRGGVCVISFRWLGFRRGWNGCQRT